mmetsp:Transcript_24944/g.46907  ORF Transcript_24944/g.46907 Transcript_24944/m.46907 type:complete len:209 (-) Transcript_24944:1410-2036(-)
MTSCMSSFICALPRFVVVSILSMVLLISSHLLPPWPLSTSSRSLDMAEVVLWRREPAPMLCLLTAALLATPSAILPLCTLPLLLVGLSGPPPPPPPPDLTDVGRGELDIVSSLPPSKSCLTNSYSRFGGGGASRTCLTTSSVVKNCSESSKKLSSGTSKIRLSIVAGACSSSMYSFALSRSPSKTDSSSAMRGEALPPRSAAIVKGLE